MCICVVWASLYTVTGVNQFITDSPPPLSACPPDTARKCQSNFYLQYFLQPTSVLPPYMLCTPTMLCFVPPHYWPPTMLCFVTPTLPTPHHACFVPPHYRPPTIHALYLHTQSASSFSDWEAVSVPDNTPCLYLQVRQKLPNTGQCLVLYKP